MASRDMVVLLQEFEQKLAELESGDASVDQEVREARHQIRELLSNPDKVPEPDEFLMNKLADVTEHFEADHPVLSEWLSKLSDLFSRMGI
ncbi:DUF4404 family protein [Pleionea litopenaei]|uniref:DUF4404 family protein n=1 Tax=Pleionea litopenaei TaxID=3070815 RepID=A0AA51RUC6_9GAMM|nr:DUF4404 family protein [Pleionea sp. HL-JVS1]WMS87762.1 DUF4404 family protein [Pleionea sp. HL-JVS1]